MRKPLIAGNWKMHGRREALSELADLAARVGDASARIDILICPPDPLIGEAARISSAHGLKTGAQDCSDLAQDGPHTGEVSAAILRDAGAEYVIVGHSERRARWGETNALVRAKAEAAVSAGLIPIVCVGESEVARREGRALEVVWDQLANSLPRKIDGEGGQVVAAYEPVWAVGTDRMPTAPEILDVHDALRAGLARAYGAETALGCRILYGGSVNSANARDILGIEGVDGALVGRASLKASDFAALILAHPAA